MRRMICLLTLLLCLSAEKKFIISIDDAPAPYLEEIVDFLESRGYFAIFFMTEKVSPFASNYSVLTKIVENTNFIVGNHSKDHNLDTLKYSNQHVIRRDLAYVHNYFKDNFNYSIKLYRTPYGYCNNKNLQAILRMDYDIVIWNMEIPGENKFTDTLTVIKGAELLQYFSYHFPHKRDICVLLFHVNLYIKTNLRIIFEVIEEYGRVATKKEFYENYGFVVK